MVAPNPGPCEIRARPRRRRRATPSRARTRGVFGEREVGGEEGGALAMLVHVLVYEVDLRLEAHVGLEVGPADRVDVPGT